MQRSNISEARLPNSAPNASATFAARMQSMMQRPAAIYVLTLGLMTITVAGRSMLAPTLGDHSLYIFLIPPVLIAGVLGGWGPGLLATGLGLALHLYVTEEYKSFLDTSSPLFALEMARSLTFLFLGIGISWFGDRLRHARTEASRSTQSALEREAHVKSILDTVPDAMIVIDERGSIQSFSAAAERLFGYTQAEVLGKNIQDHDAVSLSRGA